MGAKKSQGSSPVLHEKRSKDSTKSKPVLRVRKSPVFARKIAKNLGKHIVFRGFLPWTAFLSTKHGLCNEILTNTILTNLLFAIIPQGYLPCAKLSMSFIRPPVLPLLRLPVASILLQEFIFVHSYKLFFHSLSEWLSFLNTNADRANCSIGILY